MELRVITVSFKVAVASSDGKFVNQHFGMTTQFLIFEIDDNGDYKFLELRENIPACDVGGHTEDAMTTSVRLISDCKALIASHIGPAAVNILLDHGIDPYIAPMFIEEALKELVLSLKKE
jgi:predicted Fe-Mo cluster-binding NifX family protein